MTTIENVNSNGVLTRKEREELVLDLYFKENKTYSEIAKIARRPNHCICNRNPIGVIYMTIYFYTADNIPVINSSQVVKVVSDEKQ